MVVLGVMVASVQTVARTTGTQKAPTMPRVSTVAAGGAAVVSWAAATTRNVLVVAVREQAVLGVATTAAVTARTSPRSLAWLVGRT